MWLDRPGKNSPKKNSCWLRSEADTSGRKKKHTYVFLMLERQFSDNPSNAKAMEHSKSTVDM